MPSYSSITLQGEKQKQIVLGWFYSKNIWWFRDESNWIEKDIQKPTGLLWYIKLYSLHNYKLTIIQPLTWNSEEVQKILVQQRHDCKLYTCNIMRKANKLKFYCKMMKATIYAHAYPLNRGSFSQLTGKGERGRPC